MRTLLLIAVAAGALAAAPADLNTPDSNKALINRYCVTCHNQKLKTAKLSLDTLDLEHPEKDALIWERAWPPCGSRF